MASALEAVRAAREEAEACEVTWIDAGIKVYACGMIWHIADTAHHLDAHLAAMLEREREAAAEDGFLCGVAAPDGEAQYQERIALMDQAMARIRHDGGWR